MGYRNLAACVRDLEAHRRLVRVAVEVDADLEIAEIQRRAYQAGGPALLFERVKSCSFPVLGNLFGTLDRAKFLFRDTLDAVRKLVELKVDPAAFGRRPFRYWNLPLIGLNLLPRSGWSAPVLTNRTTIGRLPQIRCWPRDGGAFITLPQVYSEDVERPGVARSNLGMYRVQLSGNRYAADREVGLHYQIHRGIGVHHAKAIERAEPFHVNVFVGGPPALTVAAVMPLPEGLPELAFAGALGGRAVGLTRSPASPLPIAAEADFCIVGTVDPDRRLPEGPFGDHLGYYSLTHDFPVLRVDSVYHRTGAIWPFTSVGRPPQEDTTFGALIHELTGPLIPTVLPGVHAVNAVDAAGVHPLLLALGGERYVPYAAERKPRELLTAANAILGQGQLSLAKFLWIAAKEDDPHLNVHDVPGFFRHVLARVDWTRDLHFQTSTTIDTLDYSGTAMNEGSKLVVAAAGPIRRELPEQIGQDFRLPAGFTDPRVCLAGVLAVQAPSFQADECEVESAARRFATGCADDSAVRRFPLIVLVDDSGFTARSLNNFLWVTFTRADPASDVHGVEATAWRKHWGCRGPLIIDARVKPRHAPALENDPEVVRRVDALAAPNGPLHGLIV